MATHDLPEGFDIRCCDSLGQEGLQSLDDNSVDAVVTDPPYGLEFMGKDWDKFAGAGWEHGGRFSKPGIGQRPTAWPSYTSTTRFGATNPTCAKCGGRLRGKKKCRCNEPEWKPIGKRRKHHDAPEGVTGGGYATHMQNYQLWCEQWARECYRVLKPGGHLLAFGGTRTYHRLACAIEDAGFEIRDSIHWIYGSGFPKSLDVSKAIDKMAGAERESRGTGQRVTLNALGNGLRNRCATCGKPFFSGNPCSCPKPPPATEAAKQWDGYGTGLKPAHECIIVARKHPSYSDYATQIIEHLNNLEGFLCRLCAESADSSSGHSLVGSREDMPNTAQGTARIRTEGCPEKEIQTGKAVDISSEVVTSASTSEAVNTALNTISSWKRTLADLLCLANKFTTATAISLTTDLRILSWLLLQTTPESMLRGGMNPSGPSVFASGVDDLLNAARSKLIAIQTLSAPENVTAEEHTLPQDEIDHKGIIVARKPLDGTVAENVLRHGVGGLNIDGCRVGGPPPNQCRGTGWASIDRTNAEQGYRPRAYYSDQDGVDYQPHSAGRWPPNLVFTHHPDCRRVGTRRVRGITGGTGNHDGRVYGKRTNQGAPVHDYTDADGMETVEAWDCHPQCPVHALDEQSGERRTGGGNKRNTAPNAFRARIHHRESHPDYSGESGGASRFFPQFEWTYEDWVPFLYCPKASASERNAGCEHLEPKQQDPTRKEGSPGGDNPRNRGVKKRANHHPTVKPIALMRWLVRLVTPPGGIVLDPFLGSGTTAVACVYEGFRCIGFERESDYCVIALARISYGKLEKAQQEKKKSESPPDIVQQMRLDL